MPQATKRQLSCIDDLYELIGVGVAGGVSQDVAGRFPATEHQTSGSPSSAPGVAGPEAAGAAHAAPGEVTLRAVPPADVQVRPPSDKPRESLVLAWPV